MAKAAKGNGHDACEIVALVSEAVGCECGDCEKEIAAVDAGIEALVEDMAELLKAIFALLAALNLDPGGPPEKDDPWWKRLIRNLNLIGKVKDFVDAVLMVWDALTQLDKTISQLLSDVRALMNCCGKRGGKK